MKKRYSGGEVSWQEERERKERVNQLKSDKERRGGGHREVKGAKTGRRGRKTQHREIREEGRMETRE